MAWTQEQLDALKAAYAQGALSVRWGDKSVQFESGAELRRRIEEIEKELGQASKGHRRRIIVTDRGH